MKDFLKYKDFIDEIKWSALNMYANENYYINTFQINKVLSVEDKYSDLDNIHIKLLYSNKLYPLDFIDEDDIPVEYENVDHFIFELLNLIVYQDRKENFHLGVELKETIVYEDDEEETSTNFLLEYRDKHWNTTHNNCISEL